MNRRQVPLPPPRFRMIRVAGGSGGANRRRATQVLSREVQTHP